MSRFLDTLIYVDYYLHAFTYIPVQHWIILPAYFKNYVGSLNCTTQILVDFHLLWLHIPSEDFVDILEAVIGFVDQGSNHLQNVISWICVFRAQKTRVLKELQDFRCFPMIHHLHVNAPRFTWNKHEMLKKRIFHCHELVLGHVRKCLSKDVPPFSEKLITVAMKN